VSDRPRQLAFVILKAVPGPGHDDAGKRSGTGGVLAKRVDHFLSPPVEVFVPAPDDHGERNPHP
jgi:hypothetical protein